MDDKLTYLKAWEDAVRKTSQALKAGDNELADKYFREMEDAYELTHRKGLELMRSKYCVRYELGLCPVHQGARDSGPLYLLNNGRRLKLDFNCRACEMTVLPG